MPLFYRPMNEKKCIKEYGFLSLAINLSNKYGKKNLDAVTKSGLDALML